MKRLVALIMIMMLGSMALAEAKAPKGGKGRDGGDMALLNEGIAFLNGDGVAQDYEAALEKFEAAIEAGNIKATRYIGMMYEQGLGVDQDYAKAAEYYEQGVQSGDLTSGYYLGLLYKQGLGVEQDYARAVELFASVATSENKSATGVVAAGMELAMLYEQGLGVEQDIEKAIDLYREAAEYGDTAAMERLESLYE